MNSTEVGMMPSLLTIIGTISIALCTSGNNTRRSVLALGKGVSLMVALVTIPRVPSEPM